MKFQVLLPGLSYLLSFLLIPIRANSQEPNLQFSSEVHAHIYQYIQERQELGLVTDPMTDISSFVGVWQAEDGTRIGVYPALPGFSGNVDRVCFLSNRGNIIDPAGFSEAFNFQDMLNLEQFSYEDDVNLSLPALWAGQLGINPIDDDDKSELPDTFEGFSLLVQSYFEGDYFVRLGDQLIWFRTREELTYGNDGQQLGEIKRLLAGEPLVLSYAGELPLPEEFLSEDFTRPDRYFHLENTSATTRQDNYVLQMFHAAGCRLSVNESLPFPFPEKIGNLEFEDASQTIEGVTISLIGGNRIDWQKIPVQASTSSFLFDAYILIENQSNRSFSFDAGGVGLNNAEGIDLSNCNNINDNRSGCSMNNRFDTYIRQATIQPGGSLVGKLIQDQENLSISEFLAPQTFISVEEVGITCMMDNNCRNFLLPLRLAD